MKVRDRDEDDESLSSPCFQIDPNVELKDIPTTGDEYLLKVMKERQSCLVVTKCNEDFSKFAKNQSCFVKEVNKGPCHDQTFIQRQATLTCTSIFYKHLFYVHLLQRAVNSAPISLKPTTEWQNIQVADFSDVRMYVSRLQAKKDTWPHAVKKIDIDCNDLATWKNFFENNSPTLTCVFGLDQALLDNGLEFLIGTLNKVKAGDTLCQTTGKSCLSVQLFFAWLLQSDVRYLLVA